MPNQRPARSEYVKKYLQQRNRDNLFRQRKTVTGNQGARLTIDGKDYLSFCSNDYLGLAASERLKAALIRGSELFGVGSGASHLVSGHHSVHEELECALAQFLGYPRTLLFSTGYMANIGVINALMDRDGLVFQDQLNHASLLDGGFLSKGRSIRYGHRDGGELRKLLNTSDQYSQIVIASDGVFSMDGDLAPIQELVSVAARHNAWLMIDDAHGFGVLGKRGGGIVDCFGCAAEDVPVLVGTFGKALGTFGAFVAGDDEFIEMLIQKSRTYIYTTASPPALTFATLESLKIVEQESWRREKLEELTTYFIAEAQKLGLSVPSRVPGATAPIVPLIVGDPERSIRLSEYLYRQGILITAIRPPTVPEGTSRLRITLSATHNKTDLDTLLKHLVEAWYAFT